MMAAGKIEARKSDGRTLIVASSLRDYLANLPPAKIRTSRRRRLKKKPPPRVCGGGGSARRSVDHIITLPGPARRLQRFPCGCP
jgi:hypothetical protein